ncbi:amidohydrolase [Jeongeupia chitinilytica]|uniref:N-acyl-L-amino acid amidohydrolase n=1 Tax=Jeongeupia chitinilytica TaxID=1041641 RepID=A0ABQ3H096_9NEIS|nr:amidohydrolase [Jeongeupia chitinilytica]GHD63918.1 N-acyl-L-amino acid amidohydrolase [Jeongeupia chitinilytica]
MKILLLALALAGAAHAGPWSALDADIERIDPQVVAWRHDIHRHPELGNREFRTAALVADALRPLGYAVTTGVAGTGVVAVLRGDHPGPTVALRAELDALPVTEPAGLPFASTARSTWSGRDVGVMHACGHDAHVAMALGVATLLAQRRTQLHGTVKLVFQPAEEGPPDGEEGGAALMIKQGVLADPKPDVFFGLHVGPGPSGSVSLSRERVTAGSDTFVTRIIGRQTHAAFPWAGIDPVTLAAQVVLAWQTIPSRQSDLQAQAAPVISVGRIDGGVRQNIIPEAVTLEGTVRTVSPAQREAVLARLQQTAGSIAASAGGRAETRITEGYPSGHNDPALVDRYLPVLRTLAPDGRVTLGAGSYAADDFAYFSRAVPALFVGLGVTPPGIAAGRAAPNHSPDFVVDDAALRVGVRVLAGLMLDTLRAGGE